MCRSRNRWKAWAAMRRAKLNAKRVGYVFGAYDALNGEPTVLRYLDLVYEECGYIPAPHTATVIDIQRTDDFLRRGMMDGRKISFSITQEHIDAWKERNRDA